MTTTTGGVWGAVRRWGRLVNRGTAWLARAVRFVAEPVDEVVTAGLDVAPMLPRLTRWRQHVVAEWRAYRAVHDGTVVDADVIDGGLTDGVWR